MNNKNKSKDNHKGNSYIDTGVPSLCLQVVTQ